jgi:hypothetical protein
MDAELTRVRDDLAVLRHAAGLEPAWTRAAIRTHVLLALAGALAALWSVLPHGVWPITGLAFFAIPVIDWGRSIKPAAARAPADAREVREAIAVLWYVAPLAMFMLGLVLFGPAVSERGMRPLVAWALAFMAGGLLVPLNIAPFVPVFGGVIALGAAVAAALVAIELRRTDAA